jgi:hypothetical protein
LRAERALGGSAVAVAAVCAGLVAAACSTSSSAVTQFTTPTPSASAAASPAVPSSTDQPLAPLTGLPIQASVATRPAVAMVVAGSQPQGLSDADVIYEEVASPLRYLAVFQSRQAPVVGPITGTVPADGEELSVLRPLFGYDGSGSSAFIRVLDHTSVVDLGYSTHSSLYQDGTTGLTTSTQAFWASAHSAAPPGLFSYRGPQTGSRALATTGQWRPAAVTIQLPGYGTQQWTFDAHEDMWQQIAGGAPIAVANLIIQMVSYKELSLGPNTGLTAPSAVVIGKGPIEAFSGIGDSAAQGPGGLAAHGEWSKPGLRSVTDYVDAQGFPMDFQPGPTLVILAPDGTRIETAEATS